MAYDAKVLPVMIASPSDVTVERQIVREALANWNVMYSQEREAVFLPVGWETHSSPQLAGRPQQMINDRLLKRCDLLVGIFWTRVGSDTGKAISGSIEEIQEHMDAGKPVMLYFSEVPVTPGSVNPEQWDKLQEFKAWAQDKGLYGHYESVDQFRLEFPTHLALNLRDDPYLQSCLAPPVGDVGDLVELFQRGLRANDLSEDAETMLKAAVGSNGRIMMLRHMGGVAIQAGSLSFDTDRQREASRWKGAIEELSNASMLNALGHKGEVFEVSNAGFTYAENKGWEIT